MHSFSFRLLENEATKESNAELFEAHPPSVLHSLGHSIESSNEEAIGEKKKQDQLFELA